MKEANTIIVCINSLSVILSCFTSNDYNFLQSDYFLAIGSGNKIMMIRVALYKAVICVLICKNVGVNKDHICFHILVQIMNYMSHFLKTTERF